MARLDIASRNRRGMDASASATRRSNFFRCTRNPNAAALAPRRGEEVAVVLHRALLAQRLRLADAAPVENQRVGGPRPAFRGQRGAKLLLDDFGLVGVSDADAVRDAQDVAI